MKKIAITKSNSNFQNYVNWIDSTGYPYEILDWDIQNFKTIDDCSSLLLTGGADIFPEFYSDWPGRPEEEITSGFIPERDGFEFKLLDNALERKMPILAICRGMQLTNCKLNGSLLSDIKTIRGVDHKKIGGKDRYHEVNVKEGSLLKDVIGVSSGTINSSHHQGIDRLGEGLMISARSSDGIIEAIEWDEKDGKPFFLGVQWHPERMTDLSSPFSKKILDRFLQETDEN